MALLDRQTHPISCTCGHESKFTQKHLRTELWVTCKQCGADLSKSAAQIVRGLKAGERALADDLKRAKRSE